MIYVGIVGSGFGLYGLLPAFLSIDTCKVVSFCGKKTERLVTYCKRVHLKNVYTDWREMLRNEKLDVLAIAVPPLAQYEIAKVAIKQGINIFAEKPLAANYKQAKELLTLANKGKIKHTVDFIFPEIESWQKVKQLLVRNTFGKLEHISVEWDFLSYDIKNKISSWKMDVKQGGGALSFYFPHSLYYLEYFAGEISDVKSIFSYSQINNESRIETGVDMLLKFANGVNGIAHISCNSRGLNRHQLLFTCEKGVIILENKNNIVDNFRITIVREDGTKQFTMNKKTGRKKDVDERVEVVKKLASRFVDSCISKKDMKPSFADGVRVQQLIERIRKNQIS